MAANKLVHFGPVALTTTTTTNIFNPGTTTGGTGMPATSGNLYFVFRHIRVSNKTASSAQFGLWLGATGANVAGTELVGAVASAGALTRGQVVAAQSSYDIYDILTADVADFIVGGADTATALTIYAVGEIGIR